MSKKYTVVIITNKGRQVSVPRATRKAAETAAKVYAGHVFGSDTYGTLDEEVIAYQTEFPSGRVVEWFE